MQYKKIKKLFSNDFFRAMVILTSGTAFAQALNIIALPLITRLFSPQEFGAFAIFVTLFSIVGGIASLRYEIAIPLAISDDEAANVFGIALICALVTSTVIFIIITLFGSKIAYLINSPQLNPYLWLLPITVLAGSVYSIFHYWAIRKKYFSQIASSTIDQSIIGVSVQILLGLLGFGIIGLLLGHTAKVGAGSFRIAKKMMSDSRDAIKQITPKELLKVARVYDRYPKYSTFDVLANSVSIQAPIIFIAAKAGIVEVGLLALAMKVMQTPLTLIGSSVGKVYYSQAVEENSKGHLDALTIKVLSMLAKVGVGPIIFLGILSPSAVGFVFGDEWTRAGELIRWMTPWFVMQFLSSPISMSLHIIGRQKTLLGLTIFGLAIRVAFIFGALSFFGVNSLSESYAISGAVFYSICLLIFSHYAGLKKYDFLKVIISSTPIILLWVFLALTILYFI